MVNCGILCITKVNMNSKLILIQKTLRLSPRNKFSFSLNKKINRNFNLTWFEGIKMCLICKPYFHSKICSNKQFTFLWIMYKLIHGSYKFHILNKNFQSLDIHKKVWKGLLSRGKCWHNLLQFNVVKGWIRTWLVAMELEGSIPSCNIIFLLTHDLHASTISLASCNF
jgi:hypothetical protein